MDWLGCIGYFIGGLFFLGVGGWVLAAAMAPKVGPGYDPSGFLIVLAIGSVLLGLFLFICWIGSLVDGIVNTRKRKKGR